jgi:hypothetical protein
VTSPANAAAFHVIALYYRILVDNVTRIIYKKRIIPKCALIDASMQFSVPPSTDRYRGGRVALRPSTGMSMNLGTMAD